MLCFEHSLKIGESVADDPYARQRETMEQILISRRPAAQAHPPSPIKLSDTAMSRSVADRPHARSGQIPGPVPPPNGKAAEPRGPAALFRCAAAQGCLLLLLAAGVSAATATAVRD